MKFGRILVPLIFKDEDKEITVKTIPQLKEVFKAKFYFQLVEYLHNRRLEKLFFALGMDDIKEKIEKLKEEKKEDIVILNEIAKILGFEPLPENLSNSVKFAEKPNLLEEISNQDQSITLSLNKHFLKSKEIELKGSKIFKGRNIENTELEIEADVIKGKESLVFKNLTLIINKEIIFEGFREVEFRNVKINSKKPIKFINTTLRIIDSDIVVDLYIEKSNLDAINTLFHDSKEHGIFCLESSLSLKDCKVFGNGNKEGIYPQMWIKNSIAKIENTEEYESV
ncbi:MAG: hypothetical protein N2504_02285, partial [candidate division WOR-3 bacterium]|nr:hypothetical protein [candidate division WOR-3 bacterium]